MGKYLKVGFMYELGIRHMKGEISYSRMAELIQDEVISNYTKTNHDTREEFLKQFNNEEK